MRIHWIGLVTVFICVTTTTGQQPPGPFPLANDHADAQTSRSTLKASKLSPLQRQFYFCIQRGSEWLQRHNRPNGRFHHGLLPALQRSLDGDDYLHQAGAALALMRVANWLHDDRGLALSKQAALSLLAETAASSNIQQVRYTVAPESVTNRLASAGMLVAVICEATKPGKDLLDQADQLANFIRSQQQEDGSFRWTDVKIDSDVNAEGIRRFTGPALYGLARSQRHLPASWKSDALRKACDYYHAWWKSHKNLAMIPDHAAAYTEAYLLFKDKKFADCVFAMNDWLCQQQYSTVSNPMWLGGFKSERNGSLQSLPPTIETARFAESLAYGCLTAKHVGDVARYEKYRRALERALQFTASLQFTNANCQHFTPLYRPMLIGGFHASHQNSRLRIDYNQHALSAMVLYFQHVADIR